MYTFRKKGSPPDNNSEACANRKSLYQGGKGYGQKGGNG